MSIYTAASVNKDHCIFVLLRAELWQVGDRRPGGRHFDNKAWALLSGKYSGSHTGFVLLCFSQTEQLITLWVLFVFIIVGNAIVLFSTWRRKRKSRMTFFVTQLAITGKQLQKRNGLSREFQWLLTVKYFTNRTGVLPA